MGGAIAKIAPNMVKIHSEVLPSPFANCGFPCTTPTTTKSPTMLYAKWWLTSRNPPLPSWSISPPYPGKPRPFWQSSWAPL